MAFKHYDVVRAASPSDLADALAQKFVKDGNHTAGRFLRIRMMAQHLFRRLSQKVMSPHLWW